MSELPYVDPNALYTVEQVAKLLMEVRPDLTFEQAHQMLCEDIDSGKLPIAGYLAKRKPAHG